MKNRGYFGAFGGAFIPELLVAIFDQLVDAASTPVASRSTSNASSAATLHGAHPGDAVAELELDPAPDMRQDRASLHSDVTSVSAFSTAIDSRRIVIHETRN